MCNRFHWCAPFLLPATNLGNLDRIRHDWCWLFCAEFGRSEQDPIVPIDHVLAVDLIIPIVPVTPYWLYPSWLSTRAILSVPFDPRTSFGCWSVIIIIESVPEEILLLTKIFSFSLSEITFIIVCHCY